MTITKHKFNSAQYHLMAEAGVFNNLLSDRVTTKRIELIEGEIIEMSPIGAKHGACVARLQSWFHLHLSSKVIIWTQTSIKLDEGSEPQPDLTLLRLRKDFYEERLPLPADILLIVEVADSTIIYDREVKIPLYAKFGIPQAWLIDLNSRNLTEYTEPRSAGYKTSQRFEIGDFVKCLDAEIAIADILGDQSGDQS
jgi:Uma2 family endonuclease